jgi:hypothetical protein
MEKPPSSESQKAKIKKQKAKMGTEIVTVPNVQLLSW